MNELPRSISSINDPYEYSRSDKTLNLKDEVLVEDGV